MAHCQDQKAGAAIIIASNFIPGGGLASKAVKAAIKGTSKAYKAAKATKKETTKIKRSPSKKVSSKVNKKPKTVAAKPIRTAPKVQSKGKVKVAATTVKPKKTTKTSVAPKPKRNTVVTRVEKAKVVKASKGSPKGGSSTAGKSPSSANKSSSSNKQIMEDSVDDVVGDKVTDKAKILEMNKISGAAAEKLAAEDLVSQGNIILGSQVSVRTSAGIRRIDHLIMDPAGNLKAVEVKAGNARRNTSQLRKDFLLETEGGVIIGKNAPRDLVGQFRKIPTIKMRY